MQRESEVEERSGRMCEVWSVAHLPDSQQEHNIETSIHIQISVCLEEAPPQASTVSLLCSSDDDQALGNYLHGNYCDK